MSEISDKYLKEEEYYYNNTTTHNERFEQSIKYLKEFIKIVEKDNPDLTRDGFAKVLTGITTINNRGLFLPLTLKEDEFVFKRYGISENIRRSDVKMDPKGIFYENAYNAILLNVIDVRTNTAVDIEKHLDYKFTTDDNRIYIAFGSRLSSYYFTRAYLFNSTIIRGKYFPAPPITIKTNILLADVEKIQFVFWDDYYVKKLRGYYNICPVKDIVNAPTLMKFNADTEFEYEFRKNQRSTFSF